MNLINLIKTLDHHAYFIHSFKDVVLRLKNHLKDKFNISHSKNPDFYYERFETFGIDESRKIKDIHSSRSFRDGSKRIFIIEASDITHEAQNSLLKIFEEPNDNSYFFLIMPSFEILLPTLCSRMSIIRKESIDKDEEDNKDIEKFLKLSKKEKINFVDELAKKISDEKANKSDARQFLSDLESQIYKRQGLKNIKGLKAILKAKDYMNDRSPSIKQLLEYVAMNI